MKTRSDSWWANAPYGDWTRSPENPEVWKRKMELVEQQLEVATNEVKRLKEENVKLMEGYRGGLDDLKTWLLYTNDTYLHDVRFLATKLGIEYTIALTYILIEKTTSSAKAEQFLLTVQATNVL